jgi:hypothetical protein
METWKLKYVPLDPNCVGTIESPAEPHVMQIDARVMTLILQKTHQSFSRMLQGPWSHYSSHTIHALDMSLLRVSKSERGAATK